MRTGSLEPRIDGAPAHDEEDGMVEVDVLQTSGKASQQCQLMCCLLPCVVVLAGTKRVRRVSSNSAHCEVTHPVVVNEIRTEFWKRIMLHI